MMDDQPMDQSCVPPGFRFHPTDEELVGYYLKKKVMSQKIDLDVIKDIDLYRIEPWDLQERCRIGNEEQKEWYLFSHKDKKYPTGTRTNRATMAGFWKATGRDKAIYDKSMKLIGMRKTLVFYKGRAPNGHKSDWIMHEYRLQTDHNGPPQEEGWVVCRAFKKKITVQSNHNKAILDQGWDSSNYFYNDQTRLFRSSMDTSDRRHHPYLPRNPPNFISSSSSPNNFLRKQETDHKNSHNNLNISLQPDHPFLQLPQLESPSFSLLKRPISSISLLSNSNQNNNYDSEEIEQMKKDSEKVTDWRALDKFVASQLSHENEQAGDYHHHKQLHQLGVGSSFGSVHNQEVMNNNRSEDMSSSLLHSSDGGTYEEGEKLIGGFLASSSEADLGICIFDQ